MRGELEQGGEEPRGKQRGQGCRDAGVEGSGGGWESRWGRNVWNRGKGKKVRWGRGCVGPRRGSGSCTVTPHTRPVTPLCRPLTHLFTSLHPHPPHPVTPPVSPVPPTLTRVPLM